MKCPDCDGALEKKKNKRGRDFWKCTNPICKFWGNATNVGIGKPAAGDSGKAKTEVSQTPQKGKEPEAPGVHKPKSGAGFFDSLAGAFDIF